MWSPRCKNSVKRFRLGFPIFGHQPPELAMMNYSKGRSHVEEEKGVLAQCHNKHLATRPGTASPTMAAPLSKRWHQPRPWEAPGFATLWKVEGGKKPQFMPGILGWQHSRAPYWSPSILPTKRWLERIRLLLSHRAFLNFGHSVAICVSALLWSKHIFFSTSPSWVYTESNRAN